MKKDLLVHLQKPGKKMTGFKYNLSKLFQNNYLYLNNKN